MRFSKQDLLVPFKTRGLALCTNVKEVAKYRNTLAHSYLAGFDAKTQKFTFVGLGSDKDIPLITGQAKLSIDNIIQVRAACVRLAMDLTHFSHELVGTLMS